jgi:hypothetical protein
LRELIWEVCRDKCLEARPGSGFANALRRLSPCVRTDPSMGNSACVTLPACMRCRILPEVKRRKQDRVADSRVRLGGCPLREGRSLYGEFRLRNTPGVYAVWRFAGGKTLKARPGSGFANALRRLSLCGEGGSCAEFGAQSGWTTTNITPKTAKIRPHYRKSPAQPSNSPTVSYDCGEKSPVLRPRATLQAHLSRSPFLWAVRDRVRKPV